MAILLLFPYHAARVFDHWEPFYVKSAEQSLGLSWFISVTGYWFMPLLFFLAGASSRYALRVRTNGEYARERINRLLVPFVFGLLLIVPPQCYFALKHHQRFSGSYLEALGVFFTDFGDLSGYYGSFTPAHLWFILYLFVISLLFLWSRSVWDALSNRAFMTKKWVLLLLFVPLTAAEALPSAGGQNPFSFFLLFVAGYLYGADEKVAEWTAGIRFKCLLVLLPYVPLWAALSYFNQGADDFAPVSIVLAFMRNFALILTFAVILGYGRKLAHVHGNVLSYMNEAAFPLYILHQTVLVAIGYSVVQTDLPLSVQFVVIALSTFAASLALVEGIRRWRFTRWMFGMKRGKRAAR
jgi:peptidoglycan/LPS O-acetylase OafA/YrhL